MGGTEHQYRALLTLTEEGQQAADYVCQKAVAAVNFAGGDLDPEVRKALYAALRQIEGRLETICANGIPEN